MSTLIGALGAAKSGLYARQLVLQTTGNNVANAGTPGHARHRVDLKESVSETLHIESRIIMIQNRFTVLEKQLVGQYGNFLSMVPNYTQDQTYANIPLTRSLTG